jgi:hypothetical protein
MRLKSVPERASAMPRRTELPFAVALGDEPHGTPPQPAARPRGAPERRTRHLQDNILIAFHRACDGGQYAVAAELLRLTEAVVKVEPDPRRRRQDIRALVAAHERLWLLMHPESAKGAADEEP